MADRAVTMARVDLQSFPVVLRPGVGKALLAVILISFAAIFVSVFGLAFNNSALIGPLPETVFWMYTWCGVIHLVSIATYFLLFKPWAEAAGSSATDIQPRETDTDEVGAVSSE
jgi:membrane protein implicated in regulation of membrane protease activity